MELVICNIKELFESLHGIFSTTKDREYSSEYYDTFNALNKMKKLSDDKKRIKSDINFVLKDLSTATKEEAKKHMYKV